MDVRVSFDRLKFKKICKNSESFVLDKWDSGVPLSPHVVEVCKSKTRSIDLLFEDSQSIFEI